MENKIVVAVKGVIIHDNKVLIVQRSADDETEPNTWECVGGKIDFGEELEDALMREVTEEVGLTVSVDRLLYAATFKRSEHRQVVILTYSCTTDDSTVTLSYEHQDYLWANREQMMRLLPKSIIDDFNRNCIFDYIFTE